jgi:sugar phosphate isomerase/epimerase
MKLGFVTAILPDLSFEEVLSVAVEKGYDCVEVMCWPKGKAERRYAGVTHIDIDKFTKKDAEQVEILLKKYGITISALGYYPNPLTPKVAEAKIYTQHLKKLIKAAALLGVNKINTFIGRDWSKSVNDNWPKFLKTWKPLVKLAEKHKVKIGIENCPMFFTKDEWPGGKNLATTPAIWKRMFKDIPSKNFGLNFDPSHFVWQQMDYINSIKDFSKRIFHVHAKDLRIDTRKLNEVGIMANPNDYTDPKLPGLGSVNWGNFFSALNDIGYKGAVCVEVEDRAYEGSLKSRKAALDQSAIYLRQYITTK